MSEEEFNHSTEANLSSWPGCNEYKGVVISLGCSHTAGSEIEGVGDNDTQRQKSYGAKIAQKLGWYHLNYGICGGSNHRIFDLFCDILCDIESNYGYYAPIRDDFNYLFLIGWTSLQRLDLRYPNEMNEQWVQGWPMSRGDENYIPVTVGTNPLMIKDVELRKAFMEGAAVFADNVIMANRLASYIFAIQNIMLSSPYKYYMFNAIENFYDTVHTKVKNPNLDAHKTFPPFRGNQLIYNSIDTKYYFHPTSREMNYYRYCTEVKDHKNVTSKYWHLPEAAHEDWAELIYPEIINAYPGLE